MNTTYQDQVNKDDEALEALFKQVSSRTRAPDIIEEDVRKTLHHEWTLQTSQRRKRKRVVNWSIAASVLLAIFVVTKLPRESITTGQGMELAVAEKTTGDVFIQKPGESNANKLDSVLLLAGDELSTIAGSRVAMRWGYGESVRLDENSRIVLVSELEIRLLSGKIYVDSAGAPIRNEAFSIHTPGGQVSHIGTQYITEISADSVFVSVREGEVTVGNGYGASIARRGQKLGLSTDGQKVLTDISLFGKDWQWTEKVSPTFNMDDRSLNELLDWVSRETGLQVEFASAEAKIAARQTQLHGQVDLEPLRVLELVLQTSDLTHVMKDGVILVSL